MSFRPEPPYRHGQGARTAVLLVNLGTPEAATAPALRRYLAEFLSDRRVVEIPRLVWWPILHGIILRTRPAKSAAKYASVWMKEGSPLAVWTQRQTAALAARMAADGSQVLVRHAMRYGQPAVPEVLDALRAEGATRVLVLPLYPQYAAATTASVADKVMQWAQQARYMPELRFVGEYHDDPGYIEALAARLRAHWQAHGRAERLVLSFHGLPERSLHLGDPYHCQCHKTARLLAEALGLAAGEVQVTFQSRFGKAKWLEPYTEPTLKALGAQGVKSVDVMCPGFVADCLETLEEIGQEVRDAFLGAGGESFRYVPCLNDDAAWIAALAALVERHLQGWDTRSSPDPATLRQSRERALAMGAKA
ncbi:Ferrochelatase [Rubrivivax sp. A210]|uniref:ferrochelatase n=1 Tax=Rubrivivax sp. A210 TaxID=2772301 RepID=UPI001917F0FC|nr:ferrochelatase [Rubrivivax sp. A210]CAD5367230.1 Ferrochelatase [Rubrivivax sp. A210]